MRRPVAAFVAVVVAAIVAGSVVAVVGGAGACATVATSQTPADEPMGSKDGARARALIYARAKGLLADADAKALDTMPFSQSSLLTEAREPAHGPALAAIAQALPSSTCGALTIDVEDRLTDGALFTMVRFDLYLDGVHIAGVDHLDARDARRYLAFQGRVAAGSHDVVGHFIFRGSGEARGYTWKLRDRARVTCDEAQARAVVVDAYAQKPQFAEAPRIAFHGDVAAAAGPDTRAVVVDNALAAPLTAFRTAARAGLAPSIDRARVEAALATTSPLVPHELTADDRALLDALRGAAPADACPLRISLGDERADEVPDPFALVAAHVDLDGDAIFDAPSPPPPGVHAHFFDGPVKRGSHRVHAVVQLRGSSAPEVVTLTGTHDVECPSRPSAHADAAQKSGVTVVEVLALRCIDRGGANPGYRAGLRFTINGSYNGDACETF